VHQNYILSVLDEYHEVFYDAPGQTNMGENFISTMGFPIMIPPPRIPVEVED